MSDRQGEGGRQRKVCGSRTLELLCWTDLFRWHVGDNRLATGVFVPCRQTVWDCGAPQRHQLDRGMECRHWPEARGRDMRWKKHVVTRKLSSIEA